MDRNKKSRISQNTWNKILSVFLAIVLWTVVIGGENPIKDRTIHAVPVELKNLDSLADHNLAIAGDTDYTVDVKIKGQRTTVDPLTVNDILVEADLFGYGKGQNYINVTALIPDNTELVEIRSPRIQVVIEDLVAVSKPVNINFTNVPEGKEVGGLMLQPASVEVSGAKSLVDSVAWAFGTVNTAETEAGKPVTVQVELQPLNDGEVMVENVRMSSQFADVTYTIMDVKEVPLVVPTSGDPGLDKAVESFEVPESIKIRAVKEVLDTVEEISAEPVDLAALELDETGSALLTLTPVLPEGVELSRDNTVLEGTIRLKEVAAETIAYGGPEILVNDAPENLEGSIEPGMFNVTIKADPEVLETLEKEDIQLFVNAEAVPVEDGEVELKIEAKYEKPFAQVTIAPEVVKVKFVVMERD
ncbi:MAG: hypothetical protein IJ994_06485 [Firmicutes bacterium]|nr:hypothetical protein [Bacillota bacterium]MBR7147361.1 hypothetical protein [Bacillota bacterium]